jgi:hypothetical protein
MEFPPTGWEVLEAKEFETITPRADGDHVMELLAQARVSGRIVDHWRVAIGGGKILEKDIKLAKICRSTTLSPFKLRFQAWPKDVLIRRNMASSIWYDGQAMIARREFSCFKLDSETACGEDELLQEMAKEEDLSKKSFSFRFAVVAGLDSLMYLQLQGLPAAEATLLTKPVFLG